MGAKILRDLFCFQCSYQFDKRSIYDKHQKLVHDYEEKSRGDYVQMYIYKVIKLNMEKG